MSDAVFWIGAFAMCGGALLVAVLLVWLLNSGDNQ